MGFAVAGSEGESGEDCSAQPAVTLLAKVKVCQGSAKVNFVSFFFFFAAHTDTRLLQGGPQGAGSSCGVQETIQCLCY